MYDVIIIGGSFAGLSAALQIALTRRRVLLIDAGRPRNRFAASSHGFLGQDGASPAAIRAEGLRQLHAYASFKLIEANVVAAEVTAEGFLIQTGDGHRASARRLILATGVEDSLPDLPGLQERWGTSVLHCPYCHGYEVRDRPLGVLARSALSANLASLLPDWGPTTYFTGGQFEPDAEQRALLDARGVTVERERVAALVGEPPYLQAVRLADGREIPVAALFVPTSWRMASALPEALGCEFDEGPGGPYIKVDEWQETGVPGLYAAGDAARSLHNASLASADGVLAGIAAHRSLVREDGLSGR